MYLKAPEIRFFKYSRKKKISKNVELFEPSRSTEMSSVQKLCVPDIFFTIIKIIKIIEGTEETRACQFTNHVIACIDVSIIIGDAIKSNQIGLMMF